MSKHQKKRLETEIIHSGYHPDPAARSVSPPIYQTSTFAFESAEQGAALFAGKEKGFIYTRLGNPTILALEEALATLEKGYGALATATGMAAVSTIYLAFLEKEAHLIGTAALYGPSRTIIETEFVRFGVSADFIDTSDISEIKKKIKKNTRLLFVESPANPTMAITDLRACAELAREHNLLFVVDNTFASPVLQNPLELGADVVMHSLTKFINGHSDVVGGVIISRNEELHKRLQKVLRMHGGTMDPHQAWLVLRGLRTLHLRVERAQENARKIAAWLEAHPRVAWVNYPGLESHPQYELMKKQMKGPGSMISFGLRGGYEAGLKMINSVRLCTLAVSLGGIETLIQHPASMTHASVPKKEKEEAGITDDLIRLSVGCENVDDLIEDLEQALAQS
ncbi:MAG: PLP-dependent aspartate aminotransferase family protein [Candidatus Saccharicenans sp.]|jgi:methionine-gamma-lyase|nr:PLP-dependent aspartate aminotransferase family protein [Candidatus Saccharicenans sp.]MDH7574383.1 PLP-dependent aspartate aminotransferase family protein [Candidatus Saccharicenans sp.]